MKILVIGSRIPFPLHDGGAIATYQMLREMARQGADVTYFTFNTKKHYHPRKQIEQVFSFCRVMDFYIDANPVWYKALFYLLTFRNYNIIRFRSKKASLALRNLLQNEKFDVIHFEGLYGTSLLADAKADTNAFRVLRQHNVEHRIWENMAANEKFMRRIYFLILAKGLKKYEQKILPEFDAVLPISKADEAVMKAMAPLVKYFYYPAGIETSIGNAPVPNNPFSLSHIGSMEWLPNASAVQWFIREVWPGILAQYPSATFHIAGKALKKHDKQFAAPGVVNHGEVPDAIQFQNEHAIAIVPLASGSGIRMKTLESMALGKPVVSTSVGAEGIPHTSGENILIANTAKEWLNSIGMLFTDVTLAQRIGENGRKLIHREFSVQAHTARLLEYYKQNIR